MKLFNKTIDRQLFKQYQLGSDLSKQEVVAKIFNPVANGTWFILNSDPEDPDYLWAIVDLGYGAEVGSVSRSDLETYRGRFGLGFERDLSFDPVNAEELYKGLRQGKYYADGGGVERNITGLNSLGEKVKDVKGLFYWKSNEDGKIRITSGNGSVYFLEFDTLPEAEAYVKKVNAHTPNFFSSTYENGGQIEVVYERRADFKKKPIKLLLLNKGKEQKGFTFSGKDQVAVLDNYNRNKQEDLEKLWNLKGYETKYTYGGSLGNYDVVIDGDWDEPKKFKTFSLAKKWIYENAKNYESLELVDPYGDTIFVEGNSTKEDLDWLFSNDEVSAFAKGGNIADFTDNQQMIMNQNVELEHHHEELEDILEDEMPVPAWVVAKMATATQSVSDVTHYLDGQKELMEDEDEEENEEEEEDQDEIENKEVVEPINVSAGTKSELTKKFTDDALGNLRGFLKGMEGIDLRDDYTFDYKGEQFEVEPIINSDENGVSNAVFTIFDGDGEEVGEVAYSREGGKQKFTANSDYFQWNDAKFEDGGYFDGTIPNVSTYMSTYAKGGEIAKSEILGFSRNVMGTTDIEMKITGMRKPQDFIVYPIGKDDAGNVITIQSDTRIGQINLVKGVGVMSQSHSSGAYFVHLQMDKLTSFTISESDLEDIKAHIFKTAGANVGTRGIVSDNLGASGVYAKGGSLEDKLTKLENKKSDLESKLLDAQLKANEKWNNIGWGSGMRKSKLNLSTSREDSLKERIKIVEKEIEEIKEALLPKSGSVKKDWWHTVVNPNQDFNNFDDKMPIDWDVDDFKSWVVSESDLDGNVDKAVLDVVKMPQSKLLVEYLNKNGSGKNNNEFYKEFGNWQSALYDIFTQMKKDYLFKKSIKYVLKADIKTVTVKTKNGKEVTYSGADVLNGNYVLAKGGDITSKATYFGKNNVVGVELKDGTTIKPVNGYWVKKGAEPIGAEPMPTSSGNSEPKINTTEIRKDARGNWRAETNIDNFNGYDWRISTVKTYSGNLVSSAQGGKTEATGTKGIVMFKYAPYEDPNHTLEVSKPKRLTDKVVSEQHDKALAKFKKFMETGMFKGGGKISNFDKLSAKVAKEYEGKPVKSQYQEEYGQYYSKQEAQEVGDKVAGKVKAMQTDSKAFGGLFGGAKSMMTSPKYPDLDDKQVGLKSGKFVQVFAQSDNKLSVLDVGRIGSGERPYSIDISEVDSSYLMQGGQTSSKKANSGTEMLKQANELAKKIRKDGESWLDAKKRAFAQLKK